MHQVSRRHPHREINACTFRLKEGSTTHHAVQRLDALVAGAFRHRLTYKELTAGGDLGVLYAIWQFVAGAVLYASAAVGPAWLWALTLAAMIVLAAWLWRQCA